MSAMVSGGPGDGSWRYSALVAGLVVPQLAWQAKCANVCGGSVSVMVVARGRLACSAPGQGTEDLGEVGAGG